MVICGVKYCARKVRVTIEPFIQHVKSRMEDRVGVMLGASLVGNILEPKSTIRKLVSKVVRCGAVITTYCERPFRVSGERCPLVDKEARSIQSDKESQTVSPLQSLSAVRPPSFSSYKLVFFTVAFNHSPNFLFSSILFNRRKPTTVIRDSRPHTSFVGRYSAEQ